MILGHSLQNMEDESIQANASILPLAIGALALVLGGAGLYFGLQAKKELRPLLESADKDRIHLESSFQKVVNLENRLSELTTANKETESALKRIRVYGNERDKLIKKLAEELKKSESVNAQVPNAPSISDSASSNGAINPTARSEGFGSYVIKSGDSFAKVASQSGVLLQKLLDANPGVDPKRLQIGQTIVIPQN
jgi:LysM repeat protein